jgi:flagellar biosynthesis/type III secretory pathway protein FliH
LPDEVEGRTSSLSKIIKIEQLSEAEARWEKYRSEKLSSGQIDPGQPGELSSIVEDARAEAERIRREAFESGYAEGRTEGLAQAAPEIQTALSFLKKLAQSLKEEEQRLLKQVEPEIIKLAVAVAEKIVGREVAVDCEIVKRCVAQAVDKIVEREKLIVYVNPADLAVVLEYKTELAEMFDGIKNVEVVASENGLSPGGCTVETDFVKANGQIEAQVEEILQGLLQ